MYIILLKCFNSIFAVLTIFSFFNVVCCIVVSSMLVTFALVGPVEIVDVIEPCTLAIVFWLFVSSVSYIVFLLINNLLTNLLKKEKQIKTRNDLLNTEVHTSKNGVWSVYMRGDHVLIADNEGRCRHESIGQTSTAVHLAMLLAEKPLIPDSVADGVLIQETQEFINK